MTKTKKYLGFILTFALIIPCLFSLSACASGGGEIDPFSEENQVSGGAGQTAESLSFFDGTKGKMPVLNVSSEVLSATKEEKAKTSVSYFFGGQELFSCYATFKVQGATSALYPKKNYNMVLFKDEKCKNKKKVELFESWGEQSKYCLKANYIDFSQARNVVSGDIYGDVVRSRQIEDKFSTLVNGGAVDGFPIAMFINEEFYGLYTLNIPKDDWMFGMSSCDEEEPMRYEAMIMCDQWKAPTSGIDENWSNGWELEFCSTEDLEGTEWARLSFNNMLNFVVNSSDAEFLSLADNYLNMERTIDSMLYTYFICAGDNTWKNILWVTYDGISWLPSVYDMDGTWGLNWFGGVENTATGSLIPWFTENVLWSKLYKNFKEDIIDRYFELREEVLTLANITNHFELFFAKIHEDVKNAEKNKWTEVLSQEENNKSQILAFAENRIIAFDAHFQNLRED